MDCYMKQHDYAEVNVLLCIAKNLRYEDQEVMDIASKIDFHL